MDHCWPSLQLSLLAMADELYDIRNSMVLGNFAQAISDGSSIKSNPYKKPAENDAMLAETGVRSGFLRARE